MEIDGGERADHRGPVVRLLGTFDVANYGDLLLPAVTERELARRIPDLLVHRMSPFGWEHPVPMDGGELAEPLGAPTPERCAALADGCTAVVIGGGEIVHLRDELLARHYDTSIEAVLARAPSTWFIEGLGAAAMIPTAWNAVGIPFDFDDDQAARVRQAVAAHRLVAVRDELSRKRLEQVGVEREIAVVPDPAFLVDRIFDAEVLARRRRLHATLGWSPPGRYLVVQGNGSMVNEADRISMAIDAVVAERPDLGVVLISTGEGHGDAEFAQAFIARHPGRVWHPDAPLLPIDIAAILAGAETFVGISLHGAVTTIATGRRAVVFNGARQSKLRGLVDHLDDQRGYAETAGQLPDAIRWALTTRGPDGALQRIRRRIDTHFDELARMIEAAHAAERDAAPRPAVVLGRVADELAALRTAHAVRGRRLIAERDALATLLDERDARDRQQVAELAASGQRVAELEQLVAHREGELHATRVHAELLQRHLVEVLATKTLRWLHWPRRVYGWIRR